jgi:tRNA(Arg) A34 adenosine deaminase TadA
MKAEDERRLIAAIEVARQAREHGNHPFGALLTDAEGADVLEAENTVVTDQDCTAHAETNLVRRASSRYDSEFLQRCTLYTSTEPCAMCAGAIYWSGVRHVVFALSQDELYRITGDPAGAALALSCRDVFARARDAVLVSGPHLEFEARAVHEGFWR